MKYERLTNEELNDFTSRVVVQLEPTLTQQVMSLILELTEYRTKIENGTLVELPCKAGDTVYGINKNRYGFFIDELIIDSIEVTDEGYGHQFSIDVYIVDRDEEHTISDKCFGKTVFLTKAEAEQKLKELEECK